MPCGPLDEIGQAFDEAQVEAHGLVVNQSVAVAYIAFAGINSIATVASPLRLTASPPHRHTAGAGAGARPPLQVSTPAGFWPSWVWTQRNPVQRLTGGRLNFVHTGILVFVRYATLLFWCFMKIN